MGISIEKDTTLWDSARYLDSEEAQAEYLTAVLEENDAAAFADAVGIVARARGMTQLAKDAGMPRDTLYKALREGGNPTLDTVLRVLHALGIKLTAAPASSKTA
jgi:probable addiction module antidote protein